MRVSWKWLNELVEIKETPEELATLMTMAGIPVENIERLNKGLSGVKVGLIEELYPHPQADKLWVCKVLVGEGAALTIISGADNLKIGQKVPVAVPGSLLPGGKEIGRALFRGLESEGMLCSAEELGLDHDKLTSEQREGIFILPSDLTIGLDIVEVLGLDDLILELELTPNRSDCLSVLNVAYEVAALVGGKVKLPEIPQSLSGDTCSELTDVDILEQDLCRRYVARIIKDVVIKPSPLWLQQRLMALGIRPISNVVDITNYVMMEMGQPLHAFDFDTLEERRIVVRRPQAGEELVTLDNQKRSLTPDMLLIADAKKPVAIAGVMGGLATEVTGATKTILLESAFFQPSSVRRTSQALGLRSEASLRFEKGIDLERVPLAADRAAQLMQELGAGTPVAGHLDAFPNPENKYPVKLRLARINSILGTELSPELVQDILLRLNIAIMDRDQASWLVAAPSYRRDLEREIDFIEEIARLHGYDRIPITLPYGATTQGSKTSEQKLHDQIHYAMVKQGLMEIISYSFINPRHLDWLRLPEEHEWRQAIKVFNPLSEEQGIMRTTLLPSLLETTKKNLNRRNQNLKLYELGKVYLPTGFPVHRKLPEEKWFLGCVCTGKKEKSWLGGEEIYDFYHLKGVAENLLSELRYKELSFTKITHPSLHPGRTAALSLQGEEIGLLGEVHPLALEKYEIQERVVALLLDVTKLMTLTQEKVLYQPLPKFPAVSRDLAIVVPEDITAQELQEIIVTGGKNLLKKISLFDVYRGKQIKEGYKSLAFSLTWQAEDRTLTDEEVKGLHSEIENLLATKRGGDLRR